VLLTSIPQSPAEPALASAFVECLTKPVRQAVLLEAMASALSPRAASRPHPRVSVFRPRREPQG
jgi:hypothetical protein